VAGIAQDLPFDQVIINPRERPLSTDINLAQSQIMQTLGEFWRRLYATRASETSPLSVTPGTGFIADGFMVTAQSPNAAGVLVKAGMGLFQNGTDLVVGVDGISGLDDLNVLKPLSLTTDLAVPLLTPLPSSGFERYDIIEVLYDRQVGNPLSRDVLDPVAGVFNPTLVNKTMGFNLNGNYSSVQAPAASTNPIGYKAGIQAAVGAGSIPLTTSGYVRVGIIYTSNGQTVVIPSNIADTRRLLFPGNVVSVDMTYAINTVSESRPNEFNLVGPPGIQVYVCGTDGQGGSPSKSLAGHRIYILGAPSDMSTVAMVEGTGGCIPNFNGTPSSGVIAANDQLLIGTYGTPNTYGPGPSPSTPTPPPLGTPMLYIDMQAIATPGGGIPSSLVFQTHLLISY
jgi:hypothetical protein